MSITVFLFCPRCGVGGHGAALHARSCGLSTAVFSGKDVGGTCVNRGCVPSKALLAAAGRIRDMQNEKHLKELGITMEGGKVTYDRAAVAAHAENLATKVRDGLEASLKGLGVSVIEELGALAGPHAIQGGDKTYTARDIILAPGSIPMVPPGIQADEKTVFTSDGGLKLGFVPEYVAIVGSGYIGLEFSDVYTVRKPFIFFFLSFLLHLHSYPPPVPTVSRPLRHSGLK